MRIVRARLGFALLLFLAACKVAPVKPLPPAAPVQTFAASSWELLPDWQSTDLGPSWPAFLQSCHALKNKADWQSVCAQAEGMANPDNQALHSFFESAFTPYQVYNPDGTSQGLITGYYEPKLFGSQVRTPRFKYPLYAAPGDLLDVELGDVYPQLKGMRLRGRLEGRRVIPYYSRAEIDGGHGELRVLFWVDDEVDLFFLQIQGSGRIALPDGQMIKVGYADQNGRPYVSIGRKLVEMGELSLDQASMQGIRQWGMKNRDRLPALLEQNPSYVFFRILPGNLSAPLGALGVPLTDAYSLAIDPHTIPLGFPVFLSTTYPNAAAPLNRLMLAQDTGGAISGAVRADFFWGFGEEAAEEAGRMKQKGRMWVLFPKGAAPAPN